MSAFQRILVVSDTHGHRHNLRHLLSLHSEAVASFNLGDGADDMEAVAEEYPALTVYGVRGNCDSALRLTPEEREVAVSGVRFLATHGHTYGVKSSLLRLCGEAYNRGVQFALFGHTHQPLLQREEGLYLLNPGSLQEGCYAVVDITPTGSFPHLERL